MSEPRALSDPESKRPRYDAKAVKPRPGAPVADFARPPDGPTSRPRR